MTKAKAVATPTTNRTPAKSNYALPNTPIASAKRPRSSINKLIGLPSSTPLTPQNSTTPRVKNKDIDATRALNRDQMSPMHQVKHRIRVAKDELHESADNAAEGTSSSNIVDAIFSPMLKFLSGDEAEDRSITIGGDHENADFLLHAESSKNDDLEIDLSPREKRENEGERMSTGESDSKILEKRTNEEEDTTDLGFEVDEHSSQESEDYDDDEEEFNPYAFIKALPKYEEVKSLRPPVALPPKEADARPISLVLDLDETLVHCTVEACDDADFNFPVEFHGMTYQVYVRKRPYLKEFLENVAGKFEVIVFTASQQVYADALLNLIDPGKSATPATAYSDFNRTWS